jgi:hypothetical protein
MTDGDIPTLIDQVGNVLTGLMSGSILGLNADLGLIENKRVAPNGNDGQTTRHVVHLLCQAWPLAAPA